MTTTTIADTVYLGVLEKIDAPQGKPTHPGVFAKTLFEGVASVRKDVLAATAVHSAGPRLKAVELLLEEGGFIEGFVVLFSDASILVAGRTDHVSHLGVIKPSKLPIEMLPPLLTILGVVFGRPKEMGEIIQDVIKPYANQLH